ncbi:MAG: 50S ribosomal protein L1, partial [Sulfobacillus thermosulfidooxidans]
MSVGKRYVEAAARVEKGRLYDVSTAIQL